MNLSIAIAAFTAVALTCSPADANTCEAAETAGGLVIPNLTGNKGCSDEPMKGLCKAFLACLRSHVVCLAGSRNVYGGTTARDFSGLESPFTFGTRRVRTRTGEEVCFLAGLGQAPGEEVPSWASTLVEPNGWQRAHWDNQKREWLRSPADFFLRSDQAVAKRQPAAVGRQ